MTNPTTPTDRYKTGIFVYLDFLTALTNNTDGWGNKLVTIFAYYARTVIMTKNPTKLLVNLLAAGRQYRDKSGLITYTWTCKNCAMVACPPGQFFG